MSINALRRHAKVGGRVAGFRNLGVVGGHGQSVGFAVGREGAVVGLVVAGAAIAEGEAHVVAIAGVVVVVIEHTRSVGIDAAHVIFGGRAAHCHGDGAFGGDGIGLLALSGAEGLVVVAVGGSNRAAAA